MRFPQFAYAVAAGALLCIASTDVRANVFDRTIDLVPLGSYATGIFDESGAETVAYDARTRQLFVTNAAENALDVLDVRDPANPTLVRSIDLSPYGDGPNSVAASRGRIAVAVEADPKQAPGAVVFFDRRGHFVNSVRVGALPDMLTFSPNGRWLVVACEGEPNDYLDEELFDENGTPVPSDPEGRVAIVDMRGGPRRLTESSVRFAGFGAFDDAFDPQIRVFGPGATFAQDVEPEYVVIDRTSRFAYVVLQENNAVAKVDIRRAEVLDVFALGTKDWSTGPQFDASNRDDAINFQNWPTQGFYMPDAMDIVHYRGESYLLTANEGDARDYDGFSEEVRVDDLTLDPTAFPDAATLQLDENLGRLKTTTVDGDVDGDGDYDVIYSYGARSFSVWNESGELVWDSGDDFERITAALLPDDFNSNNDENDSFDARSDDKGPEPEALEVGRVLGRKYAFIGAERVGGIFVYDVTDPTSPEFVQYVNNRDFSGDAEAGTAGDLGPEEFEFIPWYASPTRRPLLAVANEVSGTTTLFEIRLEGVASFDDGTPVVEALPGHEGPTELARSDEDAVVKPGFRLLGARPNPFNPATAIQFELPRAVQVDLRIYDQRGRLVRVLDSGVREAGRHQVRWNGIDDAGRSVGSGTYYYRLRAGDFESGRAMTLVK